MPTNRGYSLIEMIVVIMVLAIALTGVSLMINQAVQQSPAALVQTRAMELAHSYLDEILARRFDENSRQGGYPRCDSTDLDFDGTAMPACSAVLGPDIIPSTLLPENRNEYDDVDDYHGINDDPPVSALGVATTNYGSYSVSVTVSYAGTDLGLANSRAKRITVSVTTPLGNSLPVSAYRVNY